jgi:hypothetical protein
MPSGFVSIHGRRLGISSTGGISQYINSTGGGSTAITQHAQMWGSGLILTTTSTGGATLGNNGVSLINTSATAATFSVAAPAAGVSKEIWLVSSASAITFNTTATSVVFKGHGKAASTAATLTAASLDGVGILLRGFNSSEWGIVMGSTVIQA